MSPSLQEKSLLLSRQGLSHQLSRTEHLIPFEQAHTNSTAMGTISAILQARRPAFT